MAKSLVNAFEFGNAFPAVTLGALVIHNQSTTNSLRLEDNFIGNVLNAGGGIHILPEGIFSLFAPIDKITVPFGSAFTLFNLGSGDLDVVVYMVGGTS